MREPLRVRVDRAVHAHAKEVLDLTRTICEIPAPPFGEERRAEFVRDRFAAMGLETWIDNVGNVFARRPGRGDGNFMVTAHTDTVFPAGVDVSTRRDGDRLVGPGIGDNSLSVAALLMLPPLLDAAALETGPDLLLCANVGEEGLGDLRGMRKAIADHREGLQVVVVVEGHGIDHVITAGIGSRRFRVTVETPGGHSWAAFGVPNAIHEIAEIVARIAKLPVPREPKTTFNVGEIEGGVSVNTIAPRASFTLDLRSEDAAALEDLVAGVHAIVQAATDPGRDVNVGIETIGDRPAGRLPDDAALLQTVLAVRRELGLEDRLHASSTDANIPLAEGIPAVCIGLTSGGNTHREDEYIETGPVSRGLTQLALLVGLLTVPAS